MSEWTFYIYAIDGILVFAAVTFVTLSFITAPYGRHRREGWGPTLPHRLGWVLMESPAVIGFVVIFLLGDAIGLVSWVFLALWQGHYLYRTFLYPFLTRTKGRRMPWLIPVAAFLFNGANAYLNARWISHFGAYEWSWLADPRFVVGVACFLGGFVIHVHADQILIHLRKPGESDYKIPRGGLYRWVSAPNYLGELIMWAGWALATWSPAGLAFFVYTAANLVPRARDNHAWYRETFEDYPEDRRALVPFVF